MSGHLMGGHTMERVRRRPGSLTIYYLTIIIGHVLNGFVSKLDAVESWKKSTFRCPHMINGTDLRRSPQGWGNALLLGCQTDIIPLLRCQTDTIMLLGCQESTWVLVPNLYHTIIGARQCNTIRVPGVWAMFSTLWPNFWVMWECSVKIKFLIFYLFLTESVWIEVTKCIESVTWITNDLMKSIPLIAIIYQRVTNLFPLKIADAWWLHLITIYPPLQI